MGNNSSLFSNFPPIDTKSWEEQILKDLKGQDYDKKLKWKTLEGFTLNPYYRNNDLESLDYLSDDTESVLHHLNQSANNDWLIQHMIHDTDAEKANQSAVKMVEAGVNSLLFNASELNSIDKLEKTLLSIDITKISISFWGQSCNRFMRNLLSEYISQKSIDPKQVKGYFDADPYGSILQLGDYPDSPENLKRRLYELIDSLNSHLPHFRGINLKGQNFHNAGATSSQELAYVLALGVEYLSMLQEQGLEIEKSAPHIQLSFGIGSNYFIEIAKIRAARILWAKVLETFGMKKDHLIKTHIHAETAVFNKSIYDPHTNLLRLTTESMSAILGGVDSLYVRPFDQLYKNPNEFSERISKNIQLLLKEESYLDKVADPSSGSYYIETITDKIAAQAWETLKNIEKEGGFLEAIRKEIIQKEIKETNIKRQELVAKKKEHILGASLYPNTTESILDQLDFLVEESQSTDTPYKTINQYRKAIPFENLRLNTEKFINNGNKSPVVFMLPIGNPAMASARQIFSRNFFGCAGFDIKENARFATIKEGAEKACQENADIIVICSADDQYEQYCAELIEEIKEKNIKVVVASYPADQIDHLQSLGVYDFIHMKTNVLDSLNSYQQLFHII
jgi:methylmalonyl-CoA mutase